MNQTSYHCSTPRYTHGPTYRDSGQLHFGKQFCQLNYRDICGETGIPDDGLPQSDYSSSEITVELKAALASSSLAVEARMTAVLESPTFTK